MTLEHIQVARLAEDQINAAGEMSARALFDDPLAVYGLPDPATRAEQLAWFNGAWIRYAHLFGRVDAVAGQPDGVAAWLPPCGAEETPERLARAGIDQIAAMIGEAAAGRFAVAFAAMEARIHAVVPVPHWYLFMLVVDPPRQGQGSGSALLRAGLDRAAANGVPACLLTMQPRNVPFYTRHGMCMAFAGKEASSGNDFWIFAKEPIRTSA